MTDEKLQDIIDIVEEHGLLKLNSNEILRQEDKYNVFLGVMTAIGQPITKKDCPICISDGKKALKRLKSQLKRNLMAKKKSKSLYEMFAGFNFYFKNSYATRANLTDDLARDILKCSPNSLYLFEKYPDNWQEDCQKSPKKAEVAAEE
jgi:hypothetical protein